MTGTLPAKDGKTGSQEIAGLRRRNQCQGNVKMVPHENGIKTLRVHSA
jgi:hypothetical protein